jgi:hypothetical protein
MRNPKTTGTGILILLSIFINSMLDYLQHGTLPNLPLVMPQIIAALGLITARDAQ